METSSFAYKRREYEDTGNGGNRLYRKPYGG